MLFFVTMLILKKLFLRHLFFEQKKIVVGSEVNAQWFEKNLNNLDFFSTNCNFIVLQAEQIPVNLILDQDFKNVEQKIIFFFNDKDSGIQSQLEKKIKCIKILPPIFWEIEKLLNFYCQEMKIKLKPALSAFLLETIEHNSRSIVSTLKLLHFHFKSQDDMTVEKVSQLITSSRLDQFKLADLFGQKKRKQFFKLLVSRQIDFNTYRSFFSFMQNHLFKILDPSYCQHKNKVSQYDRKILACSSLWNKEELRREMRFFGQLEMEAKKKSIRLQQILERQLASLCLTSKSRELSS